MFVASTGICQEKICGDLPSQGMVQKLLQSQQNNNITEAGLDELIERLNSFEKQNKKCIETIENELTKLNISLEAIGPATETETPEIAKQRKNLLKQKGQLENQLAESKLLAIAIQDGLTMLQKTRSHLASQQLFYREQGIYTLFLPTSSDTASSRLKEATLNFLSSLKGYFDDLLLQKNGISDLSPVELIVILLLTVIGGWLGIYVKKSLFSMSYHRDTVLETLMKYANLSYLRYLPFIIPLAFAGISIGFVKHSFLPDNITTTTIYTLLFYFLILATLTLMVEGGILPLDTLQQKNVLKRCSIIIAIVLPFIVIIKGPLFNNAPPLILETARILAFLFTIIGLFWVLAAIKLTQPTLTTLKIGKLFLIFIFAVNVIGYHNLAEYLLIGLLLTIFFSLIASGLTRLLTGWFRSLLHGQHTASIRERLGIRPGKPFYAVLWLQMSIQLLVWTISCILILDTWDVKGIISTRLKEYLIKGIQIGELTISPIKVFIGFSVFLILWICARTVKHTIKKRYKTDKSMDPGAVDALVTISGYVGFIIAVLVGALIAGINLSNLALIAGALSVGIGFGLQNIINNFVSGLILLFEQPIKKGDWIVIGNTEGFVKRISVRSTVIQSFDNADIIVPNSDLISKEVINWTHDDQSGRLRIPVGVAYGSDIELVRSILLEIAMSHPKVLHDEKHPKPKVLFRNFGDSSLDFMLVCYIQNIKERFDVETDLRSQIDARFRAAGITIPFPQRDVHIIQQNKE